MNFEKIPICMNFKNCTKLNFQFHFPWTFPSSLLPISHSWTVTQLYPTRWLQLVLTAQICLEEAPITHGSWDCQLSHEQHLAPSITHQNESDADTGFLLASLLSRVKCWCFSGCYSYHLLLMRSQGFGIRPSQLKPKDWHILAVCLGAS